MVCFSSESQRTACSGSPAFTSGRYATSSLSSSSSPSFVFFFSESLVTLRKPSNSTTVAVAVKRYEWASAGLTALSAIERTVVRASAIWEATNRRHTRS